MVVNGVKSDWAPVFVRCPQGRRSWTIVILVVVHKYITKGIETELRLFADDYVCLSVYYREIKTNEDTVKLQENIDRVGCWAWSWACQMQYNADYMVPYHIGF